MMPYVITAGSIAFDHLYTFTGNLNDSLKPSRAINVEDKAVEFGGCAANIAYIIKKAGGTPLLVGIAGSDFAEYDTWLEKNDISTKEIIRSESDFSSHASIITDKDEKQFAIFYEGAAAHSAQYKEKIAATIEKYAPESILAISSPNPKPFMEAVMNSCMKNNLPFIFDPGQAMPLFSPAELDTWCSNAFGLTVNESEAAEISPHIHMNSIPLVIITKAEKGADIYFRGQKIEIPAVQADKMVNPTGCGDAFRGGFLAAVASTKIENWNNELLKKAGEEGAKQATYCLGFMGTQN